ncbi:MAG: site-specific integrase [Isosphaeraceae bacterium]|nr:site-specific integrase [Isosphaeraceae bacterium]
MRIEQGLLLIPVGVDIVAFMRNGGKAPAEDVPIERTELTLGHLRDRRLATHGNGSLEKSSLDGIRLHFKHLVGTLGERYPIRKLSLADLQRHVDRRAKAKGIHGRLSPATIKKEIVTLRTTWNWGVRMGFVTGRFPNAGLRYPKEDEKPPFMTWREIERRVKAGGLTDKDQAVLWDALFLTLPEIGELLAHVKASARQPWVYPLFVFAAHTGARRSEMIRTHVADVDLEGGTVLIREKKRARGQRTTRRVPLSPHLAAALREWLEVHPGGQTLFSQATGVTRSKTKRSTASAVTRDEAHDHFKRTLAGSKWKVIRGWHVLRHSFASNCAASGVDQRLIDSWLGHTTEIRKRYLHLIPSNESTALRSVFGEE